MSENRAHPDHILHLEAFLEPGIPLAVARREPQPPYPLHAHDFSELVIVTRGSAVHFLPNFSYQLQSGDVFVINGEQAHGFREIRDLHLINLIYDPSLLQSLDPLRARLPGYHLLFSIEPRLRRQQRFDARLRLSPSELEQSLAHIRAIEDELRCRAPGFDLAMRAHFQLLVTFLCRVFARRTEVDVPHRLMRIADVISHLEENYPAPATLSELAAMAGSSTSSLVRNFRMITGHAPIDYLLEVRMRRAAEYLLHSDMPVQTIAEQVGIDDGNYFSRQFRKRYGCSPRALRKRARPNGPA